MQIPVSLQLLTQRELACGFVMEPLASCTPPRSPTLETCPIASLAATSEFVAYILSMFNPILPARFASPTQAFFITKAKIIIPIINSDSFAKEDVRLSDNLNLPQPWALSPNMRCSDSRGLEDGQGLQGRESSEI
jgi:hypothetical protein